MAHSGGRQSPDLASGIGGTAEVRVLSSAGQNDAFDPNRTYGELKSRGAAASSRT